MCMAAEIQTGSRVVEDLRFEPGERPSQPAPVMEVVYCRIKAWSAEGVHRALEAWGLVRAMRFVGRMSLERLLQPVRRCASCSGVDAPLSENIISDSPSG